MGKPSLLNKHNRLIPNKLEYIKLSHEYWSFNCLCGGIKIVRLDHYKTNYTKSCGCLRKEIAKERNPAVFQKTAITSAWCKIRWTAKQRNHEFTLTKEEWLNLVKQNCFYCKSPPSNTCRARTGIGDFVYNGLDRQDNSKGYSIENAVPCCYKCNSMKSDFSLEEFIKHILLLAEKLKNS